MRNPCVGVIGTLSLTDCMSVFGHVDQPLTLAFLSDGTLHRYARSRGWGCMQFRPCDWEDCHDEVEQIVLASDAVLSVGPNESVRRLCELRQIPFKVI